MGEHHYSFYEVCRNRLFEFTYFNCVPRTLVIDLYLETDPQMAWKVLVIQHYRPA